MRNYLYIALLLSCFKPIAAETFEERIWKEINDNMNQMRKRFDAIEKFMNESFPNFNENMPDASLNQNSIDKTSNKQNKITPVKKTIEISNDNNFVIIKLNLGELDSKEINIEADGNTLDGKIPLKDGSASFSIQNGRLFELSARREHKKTEDKNDNKTSFHSFESSSSAKIESLPDIVANLENTKVIYKDGVVELKLPKLASAQKKTTKLNVNVNTN